MLAETPAPVALILSRSVASVSLPVTVMDTGSRPTRGTKFSGGCSQRPICSVIMPAPTASLAEARLVEPTTVWLVASEPTLTE